MPTLPPKELIRRLVARGFSQSDLAKKCGVSRSTISKLSTGRQMAADYSVVDALRRMYKKGRPE